ncbi:protein-glucosylgalactosylhydroxylysine glucosidase [Aedes aegypti]|uniref:Protein-glucosylgalactosylhydroxylysine glucosidase n=1 Tax=Aedes aegypti TaxID=7159 RepID=A0A1S4FCZ7_AEDAE|nr:protein-glucosylgalactosylhydroxylysine glucosidase [Aedes aegypti]
MASINLLSILIIAICSTLGLAIDTNYLFNSDRFPEASSVPTLSNGNLGFTVFSDSVYLTGVYNGRESQSHRARIPNYANIQLETCSYPETNPPYCSYQLDIKFGRFQTVYDDPNGLLRLIHTVYPHRYLNHVIVNHIRIQRLSGQGTLYANIRRTTGSPSADISFDAPQYVDIRDKTFLYQCGLTNEVEDTALQAERKTVCVYYSEIPATLMLSEDRTAEDFSFYTVFARSQANAEEELRLLTMSTASNLDRIQETRMNSMWDQYGITVDGNDELDRAIKSSAFQLFSNIPTLYTPNSVQTFGISPSGIGRNDFQGHVMWDYDMWMFPIVLLTDPTVAQNMLTYRTRIMQEAVQRNAELNNIEGWQYPWASAFTGREVTSTPGAAELQHHITADIAFAIRLFLYATDNLPWLRTEGCDLAFNTARFWMRRAVYNSTTDKYDIRAVTGPDTMNSNVINNVFTNVVAAHNLFLGEYAGCVCESFLNLQNEDLNEMLRTARALHLLHDSDNDFNPQFEDYAVGRQIAQADAVLLGYPLDLAIENSTKRNNLNIYGSYTSASSSAMTWSMHTIGWLELDELTLAADNLRRSYQPYLRSPFNVWNQGPVEFPGAPNYVSGAASFLHTMINGYGGIRLRDGEMVIRPRLPPGTTRLSIPTINFNRFRFSLEVHQDGTFTIMQQAIPTAPTIQIIIDGVSHEPCGLNTACAFHGTHSAILKLVRSDTKCQLKPTELNIRLADQNHAVAARISPMIFVSIVIASVLNKFV